MADLFDYWITFRISDEKSRNGRDYNARYTALISAVGQAATHLSWDEPTSFFLIRSSHGIDAIAQHVKKAIDPTQDMVLMRRLDKAEARITGVYYQDALTTFLPYLKNA